MTNQLQATEPAFPRLRDASSMLPRLEPTQVQQALGAEDTGAGLAEVMAPVTLFAVRQELLQRLQSHGGRPGLSGTSRRAKIPLSDQDWHQLEQLATALASPGFTPTAGQVASVLLTLSLHSVVNGASEPAKELPCFLRELAAAVATTSADASAKALEAGPTLHSPPTLFAAG